MIRTPTCALLALCLLPATLALRAEDLAITHARVLDIDRAGVLEDHTVLVSDGRISAIGPSAELSLPEGVAVTDAAGKTLIPGLVMVHEHFFYSDHLRPEFHVHNQSYAFPRLYLAAGITTARTGAAVEPYTDLALARAVASGDIPGPDYDVTSALIGGPETIIRQAAAIGSAKQAREFVNFWADAGVTSYKLYMSATPDIVKSTVAAAHRRGLKVTGHLCATTYAEAAALGIDNLEHGFFAATDFVAEREPGKCVETDDATFAQLAPEQPAVQSLYRTLIDKGVAVTSTLAVFASGSTAHHPLDPGTIEALSPAALANFVEYRGKSARRQQDLSPDRAAVLRAGMALELGFHRAGGTLLVGTDPTGPGGVIAGHGSHWALELLQEAGFAPMEVLQIATLNGARYLGRDRDIGSIAVGKRADMVLVDGAPDLDVSAIRRVETVYKNGKAWNSQALQDEVRHMVGGPVGLR